MSIKSFSDIHNFLASLPEGSEVIPSSEYLFSHIEGVWWILWESDIYFPRFELVYCDEFPEFGVCDRQEKQFVCLPKGVNWGPGIDTDISEEELVPNRGYWNLWTQVHVPFQFKPLYWKTNEKYIYGVRKELGMRDLLFFDTPETLVPNEIKTIKRVYFKCE